MTAATILSNQRQALINEGKFTDYRDYNTYDPHTTGYLDGNPAMDEGETVVAGRDGGGREYLVISWEQIDADDNATRGVTTLFQRYTLEEECREDDRRTWAMADNTLGTLRGFDGGYVSEVTALRIKHLLESGSDDCPRMNGVRVTRLVPYKKDRMATRRAVHVSLGLVGFGGGTGALRG